ncbi:MAG: arginine--tRNA ligase [Verrucomicrobia bacterium]|nr:arginine--tRNA ligase [Verrucomicrobiota bacterium]
MRTFSTQCFPFAFFCGYLKIVIHKLLETRLQQAVLAVLPEANVANVLVRPCPDAQFGDYQSNALMSLAKERKMNPRQLAEQVKARLDVADLCESMEIAGAAFLNFRIKNSAIAEILEAAARGEHLFFQKTDQPRTVVVDFSSPNVAKPMHVGHIRSTILGDSIASVLRLLGHEVVTDNHIGDWGTQFGKLLIGWKHHLDREALKRDPIGEMERLYKLVNSASDADEKVLESARQELVKLQSGDEENLRIWREMIALSQHQFDEIYGRLGVKFDHALGESFYNPWLKEVVSELLEKGIARETQGAIGVFSEGSLAQKEDPFLTQREGEWQDNPCLIQKSDGAANYATTDLATLRYRLETWHPQEIVYVTDGRQQLHFRQLFATFRRWHPEVQMKLAHVWFGSILGEDGKPFKTRSGDTVKLAELLNEAEERALKVVSEKNPELSDAEKKEIARIVGIGSVKYADLQQNRQSDYIFSWDKMLSLQGNTAPYLLYAYTRVRSIFRKAGEQDASKLAQNVSLSHPDELALAKHLLSFGLVLEAAADEYRPNFLCTYLYDLSGHFARFYESCPVLKSEEPQRSSRLVLSDLTARVLKEGLQLLGIETAEQM